MSDIPCQTVVDTRALGASQDRVATCSQPSPAGIGCGSEAISSSRPHRPKLEYLENLEPDAPMRDRLEAWRRQWARELKRKKPAARQAEATA
jgi:hypothetical protein